MRDVGVGKGRAETGHRFNMAKGANHFRLFEVQHDENVVDQRRKPGALRGEVEDTELARNPGILQPELGIEIDYAVVPPQLAAIDHDRHGRGEERLGGRADLENRPRINRQSVALAAHAETLGVYKPVVGNDSDGQARYVEPLHPAGNVGFDIRNQLLHPALDSRFGRGWFRRFRGIREVESKRDDDYQRRKEDHQNTAVDFRPGYLRCTLRRNS